MQKKNLLRFGIINVKEKYNKYMSNRFKNYIIGIATIVVVLLCLVNYQNHSKVECHDVEVTYIDYDKYNIHFIKNNIDIIVDGKYVIEKGIMKQNKLCLIDYTAITIYSLTMFLILIFLIITLSFYKGYDKRR